MTTPVDQEKLREKILSLVEMYADLTLNKAPYEEGVTYIPPSGKYIGSAELKLMRPPLTVVPPV